MLFLATSALESAQNIPPATWLKLGIGIAALVVAVIVLRTVAKMNKILLGVLVFVVFSVFFFSWVYNRNEPKWMTPVIEKIAPFFPSASSYANKQRG
jgi:MFS superfamily sulfate permease-like transporter